MDSFGFSDANSAVRKKRSSTSRRPRNDTMAPVSDYQNISSLSSTPPSDTISKTSSDENNDYPPTSRKKEVSLILCRSRSSSTNAADFKLMKQDDGGGLESDEASNDNSSFQGSNKQRRSGRSSEGVLGPVNLKSMASLGHSALVALGDEHRVKKVKLKLGGVTRTINAKSPSDGASAVGSSSTKSSYFRDTRHNVIEDNVDNLSFQSDKDKAFQGVPLKDFSSKEEPIRKSKRVQKKRSLDGVLNDGLEVDEEIRYLGKGKTSQGKAHYREDIEEGNKKVRRLSKVSKGNGDSIYSADIETHGYLMYHNDDRKSKIAKVSEDSDYMEEEEPGSDGEEQTNKRKKTRKELNNISVEPKTEMVITTRRRALQSGKDVSSSMIEFPNGLPPAPPKKQKEQLSELEQQLKRAEALKRRRMQVEKAARESEAEAIRKILGQDSSRKKREEKIRKQQEELAQERAANAKMLMPDRVRWVNGPSGTVVTFPDEMGLPCIFDSKPSSYPPPREKCAGPSCMNAYKYRDSKSKLPLCSLQCYKAMQEKMEAVSAC